MASYFQILISLFSILNPILAITIYLDITDGMSKEDKRKIAVVCATTVFVLLTGFLFIGQLLLSMLNVHDYSINLAGGLVVLLIGILMITGPVEPEAEQPHEAVKYSKDKLISLGISPLALPMVVGPAAIVMVMLYGKEVHGIVGKVAVTGVLAVISLMVFGTLMAADYIAKGIGKVGLVVLTKIMGLIISAVAVEMMINGLKAVLPILVKAA
jgi:multiple antibiotic resistance protein